jgi:methylase of polypeptide subunit release factors
MVCLEIGPGSGAVSAGLSELLKVEGAKDAKVLPFFMAVDKNPAAARCTSAVFQAREVMVADVIQGSLTDCLRQSGFADVVICNPPYVPTDEDEMQEFQFPGQGAEEVVKSLMF